MSRRNSQVKKERKAKKRKQVKSKKQIRKQGQGRNLRRKCRSDFCLNDSAGEALLIPFLGQLLGNKIKK